VGLETAELQRPPTPAMSTRQKDLLSQCQPSYFGTVRLKGTVVLKPPAETFTFTV